MAIKGLIMKKELTIEKLAQKLRKLYIKRYEALYIENDCNKGNRLELQFTKIEEQLIVLPEGVQAMTKHLSDESEIVRYYSASTLISIYPKPCIKILKQIEKKGETHLAGLVKYVIKNYEEGNNYFEKFLAERK